MDEAAIQRIVFLEVTILVPLILAIAVHEWAHVAMARFLGDDTGTRLGRFTLNPLAHIDPVWTLAVPALFVFLQAGTAFPVPFFGAGKPAPYDPVKLDRRFNGKRINLRFAEALVALAGPLSNVALMLLSVGGVVALNHAGFSVTEMRSPAALLFRFALLNANLAVFNLIPIPPLDGSKVIAGLLPRAAGDRFLAVLERTGIGYFFLALLFLGGARFILAPVTGLILSVLSTVVS